MPLTRLYLFFGFIYSLVIKRKIPGVLVVIYRIEKGNVEYLLLRSKHYATSFHFPSGVQGVFEKSEETAKREVHEETGLPLTNLQQTPFVHEFKYPYLPFKPYCQQNVFISQLTGNQKIQLPKDEIHAYSWGQVKEVVEKIHFDSLKDVFTKVDAYIATKL